MDGTLVFALAALLAPFVAHRVLRRVQLSLAKHPSLRGHARMSLRVARLLPGYTFGEEEAYDADGAPAEVAAARREGLERLSRALTQRSPASIERTARLRESLPDLEFTSAYRVPFPFRDLARRHLAVGNLVSRSADGELADLDGRWSIDLTGAYGVNLFGYDFYKECIDQGAADARALGPVLGPYHPVVEENVRRLKEISGHDAVSFHMSGTEAVMQAVRLARYHTRRRHLVRFCGAYHGWWDSVQPGVGNPRPVADTLTLKEMDAATLRVLRTRRDIACVLVNPLQALHPNGGAPSDASLVSGRRGPAVDLDAYRAWLAALREVCTARGIVLIIDEVFLGFRLALGGAQEAFDVRADLVTYGKTVGGGLPIGVVCGRADLMKRYDDERPADVCFARGTFNSHPYVMASMRQFLRRVQSPARRAEYAGLLERWDARAAALNERMERRGFPIRVTNLASVFTTHYVEPSRYHWMFQYYLRAQGLWPSWVGTGRFIFGHDLTDARFEEIADRFEAAAGAMAADGWWWRDAALTERSIRRRMIREVARALWRRIAGRGRATPPDGARRDADRIDRRAA
ncbi:MAG: aminotransferase class III-fold pyridoxal phosphate-dependent enzyme [Planctomycetota bacterium JB042]